MNRSKVLIYPLVLMLVASVALAATMSRSMPDRVQPGEQVTVTFSVSGMEAGKEVAVSEVLPSGWTIQSWDVSGSKEAKSAITYRKKAGNEHQWSFTASSASPSVTYTTTAPQTAGSYDFDAVYVLPPASIDNLKKTLSVRAVVCGDGVCESGEDSQTCVADCPAPAPQQPVQPAAPEVQPPAENGTSALPFVLLAVVVLAALGYYFLVYRRKQPKAPV